MNQHARIHDRKTLPAVAVMATVALLLAGCGKSGANYYEHDNDAVEISGKINLDLVKTIVPRLKVGTEEGRLNEENIQRLLRKIKNKQYESFRIKAYIIFDEHTVTMYESELFEKGKNEPDPRELREMKKRLNRALQVYRSI